MKCLIDVITNRKNTFILNTRSLEIRESPGFIDLLSESLANAEVITDNDGGILTDHVLYYHLALNPMLDEKELKKMMDEAK